MGKIYSSADEVIMWLGEPRLDQYRSYKVDITAQDVEGAGLEGAAEQEIVEWGHPDEDMAILEAFFTNEEKFKEWPIVGAFCILRLFVANSHLHTLPFFRPGFDITIYPSELWQKSARALDDILSCAYWKRVWIVQEAVLARNATVYYGAHHVPLSMFIVGQYDLHRHYHTCCSQFGVDAHNTRWSLFTSFVNHMSAIKHITKLKSSRAINDPDSGKHGLTLYEVISGGLDGRKASDPRDYIYGLCGLVQDWKGQRLEPDYSLSTAQVYAHAAFKIIKDMKSLYLLAWNERARNEKRGFPSWVPDWSHHGIYDPNPYHWYQFRATGEQELIAELHKDSVLAVSSVMVDEIAAVGPIRTWEWQKAKILVNLLEEWREMAGLNNVETEKMYDRNTTMEEAFFRTLFSDCSSTNPVRRATADDIANCQTWWAWLQKDFAAARNTEWATVVRPPELHDIMQAFEDRTRSRRFFLTKQGRFGTGPGAISDGKKEISVGDEIHAVIGSSVPLVFRRVESSHVEIGEAEREGPVENQIQSYSLVGTCYVHGIMDGEGLKGLENEIKTVHLL